MFENSNSTMMMMPEQDTNNSSDDSAGGASVVPVSRSIELRTLDFIRSIATRVGVGQSGDSAGPPTSAVSTTTGGGTGGGGCLPYPTSSAAAGRLDLHLQLMSVLHSNLLRNQVVTQRSLYYSMTPKPEGQEVVNRAINYIGKEILQVPRSKLFVEASSKGLIAGCLCLNGTDLLRSCPNGYSIPGSMPARVGHWLTTQRQPQQGRAKKKAEENQRQQWQPEGAQKDEDAVEPPPKLDVWARYIIIVEKDTVFSRLLSEGLFDKLPCILITGKGFPDLATKAMVKYLTVSYPDLVVLGLCDYNAAGVNILLQYKKGNPKIPESLPFAVSALKWLGVHHADVVKPSVGLSHRQPLVARDVALLRGLLTKKEPRTVRSTGSQLQHHTQTQTQTQSQSAAGSYLLPSSLPNSYSAHHLAPPPPSCGSYGGWSNNSYTAGSQIQQQLASSLDVEAAALGGGSGAEVVGEQRTEAQSAAGVEEGNSNKNKRRKRARGSESAVMAANSNKASRKEKSKPPTALLPLHLPVEWVTQVALMEKCGFKAEIESLVAPSNAGTGHGFLPPPSSATFSPFGAGEDGLEDRSFFPTYQTAVAGAASTNSSFGGGGPPSCTPPLLGFDHLQPPPQIAPTSTDSSGLVTLDQDPAMFGAASAHHYQFGECGSGGGEGGVGAAATTLTSIIESKIFSGDYI